MLFELSVLLTEVVSAGLLSGFSILLSFPYNPIFVIYENNLWRYYTATGCFFSTSTCSFLILTFLNFFVVENCTLYPTALLTFLREILTLLADFFLVADLTVVFPAVMALVVVGCVFGLDVGVPPK